MRFRDQYDWIVLGTHPGALLSGALVARLGLSVLILPVNASMTLSLVPSSSMHKSSASSSASQKSRGGDDLGGQWIDPETNYLLGLGAFGKAEGIIFRCLKKLGLSSIEEELIQSDRVASQVLTPDYRVELAALEVFQSELQREIGKNLTKNLGFIPAMKASENYSVHFWNHLPERLTLNANKKLTLVEPLTLKHLSRSLKRYLKATDSNLKTWSSVHKTIKAFTHEMDSPELQALFEGALFALLSTSSNQEKVLFELLHFLSLQKTGARFKGGMSAYRHFLMELATRSGAQVSLKTECRRIFIEKGQFIGIQVASRGSVILGTGAVLGCSSVKAAQKITYSGADLFHRFKKAPKPLGWKFTIALTVHAEVIPELFQSRLIWQEKAAPSLEIEVVDPVEYQHAGNKHRILYFRTILPYQEETLQLDYQKTIASRMFKQALQILPGLEKHWIKIYPDFRYKNWENSLEKLGKGLKFLKTEFLSNSEELKDYYSFTSLEDIPETLLVYEGKGFGFKTGIQALLIANMESYPALGNLGPTVAGLESAAWAAHKAGLPGPFAD